MRNHKDFSNKVHGALYGVAIGDALGGPVEFMSADEIRRRHGRIENMIGGGWLGLKPGEVTDDTQMTIAVADGILRAVQRVYGHMRPSRDIENLSFSAGFREEVVSGIGDEFIMWYKSRPKDIGNACRISIDNAIHFARGGMSDLKSWEEASKLTHKMLNGQTAGNGSLMRTIYPALFFWNRDIAIRVSECQSDMTHLHDDARDCCAEYTYMIHTLVRTEATKAHSWLKDRTYTLSDSLLPQLKMSIIEPTGYVKNSLAVALQSVCSANNFHEAVCNAVNRGGDADTIGAIAGGLAGAIWGQAYIPYEWMHTLDARAKNTLTGLARYVI